MALLLYGFHSVAGRIRRAPATIEELYVDGARHDARMRDLVALAEQAGIAPRVVDAARIERIAPQRRHQGVAAFASGAVPQADLDELLDALAEPALLLLLDGVTDPRNLGACLRAADGAGAHAVVAPKDRAASLNEAAIQTASGAAESVPYVTVTNLARTMRELRDRDVFLVGLADDASVALHDAALPAGRGLGLVLGAEGQGMRRLTREHCDLLVRIPMAGQVASLNVAVAAGVVLYEAVRQRHQALRTPGADSQA